MFHLIYGNTIILALLLHFPTIGWYLLLSQVVNISIASIYSLYSQSQVILAWFYWQSYWFGCTQSIDVLKMSAYACGWNHKTMHSLQRLLIKSILTSIMIRYGQCNTVAELVRLSRFELLIGTQTRSILPRCKSGKTKNIPGQCFFTPHRCKRTPEDNCFWLCAQLWGWGQGLSCVREYAWWQTLGRHGPRRRSRESN